MKRFFFLLVSVGIFISCAKPPAEKEISFVKKSWEEIKTMAKKENKLIFMDAYTEWCGPCKMMAANVFTDSNVAAFYNKNFINTKFDMEKGEGADLQKKYGVNAFPTYLFINADGEVLHRVAGFMQADAFIEKGKDAMNPDKQLSTFKKKYDSGDRDGKFLFEYLRMLSHAAMNTDVVKDDYFKTQKESDLSNETNWMIINDFENNPESPTFKYLLNRQEEFSGKYTPEKVSEKIYTVLLNNAMKKMYFDTTGNAFNDISKEYAKLIFNRKEELMLELSAFNFEKNKKWSEYAAACDQLAKKYKSKDAEFLNNAAYIVYEKSEDKIMLEKALAWAKLSVETKKRSYNVDTYASLLFKLGNKKEAIEQEELAIQLAKEAGEPYDDLQKTLENFKK